MFEIAYFVTPIFFSLLGVFLTFGEGIDGKSPFTKCGSFLKCAFRKPQFFLIKTPI
jgi:hypothetical protein